jgi:uncharacterized membrane protein SpoIIM required for sporulation
MLYFCLENALILLFLLVTLDNRYIYSTYNTEISRQIIMKKNKQKFSKDDAKKKF